MSDTDSEWAALFRRTYTLVSELTVESRHIHAVLLARMETLQHDIAESKGMLADLHSDVAAQVTASEAETARLQAAVRGVETMLGRVSARLDMVTALPVPAGGLPVVEEPLDR